MGLPSSLILAQTTDLAFDHNRGFSFAAFSWHSYFFFLSPPDNLFSGSFYFVLPSRRHGLQTSFVHRDGKTAVSPQLGFFLVSRILSPDFVFPSFSRGRAGDRVPPNPFSLFPVNMYILLSHFFPCDSRPPQEVYNPPFEPSFSPLNSYFLPIRYAHGFVPEFSLFPQSFSLGSFEPPFCQDEFPSQSTVI